MDFVILKKSIRVKFKLHKVVVNVLGWGRGLDIQNHERLRDCSFIHAPRNLSFGASGMGGGTSTRLDVYDLSAMTLFSLTLRGDC